MKNKTILKSIIIILVLIEGISLYLLNRPNNKENILSNVKVEDILKDNKNNTLAIKVQDADTFEYKDAGTSSDWPSPTTHYYYGTSCVDETGADLGNTKQIVQFDDQSNTATVITKKTIYCTIYFAAKKNALDVMHQTSGTTLGGGVNGITAVDGLIRYKGTYQEVTNNFICFGTSNIDECGKNATTEQKQQYLYRIIGIQAEDNDELGLKKGQLKLIKAYPSTTRQQWYNSTSRIVWETSTMITYLNGTGMGVDGYGTQIPNFLGTITGSTGGKNWQDLIGEIDPATGQNIGPKWYIGNTAYAETATGASEEKALISENHKIGLMYASDYYNSWTYAVNKNSWLLMSHGMTGNPNTDEWTMIKRGDPDAWKVSNYYGYLTGEELNKVDAVRPVFYVSSNIKLSGTGSEDSPFIITV